MDKEAIKEYREGMKKRELWGMALAVGLLLIGILLVFVSIFSTDFALRIMDDDHLTDDSIAFRDMDNATYTWTAEELEDMMDDGRAFLFFGAGVALSGYVAFIIVRILVPSKEKDHKRYCEITAPEGSKYCPECGIDLKKLKG